jgi:protein-L-isoaspartate(D-aspartate) O-methyltransferase
MTDAAALHQALVDGLVSGRSITSPRLEAAFRAVPRHLFLPGIPLEEVYRDQFIVTKRLDGEPVSSSSQPQIMATMLEQLALEPGQRVLEIGAGSGYNAALLAHLVGDAGQVVTVDIDEDLVERAQAHLATAGCLRVRAVSGDGGLGYAADAPYDRIILTVGAWDVTPAWWSQLRPEGRLVLPLAVGGSQKSVAFERAGDHLTSASVRECLFMPLRGAFAGPGGRVRLGPPPELNLYVRNPREVAAGAVEMLLGDGQRDIPAGIRLTPGQAFGGLILWLALQEPGFCWLEGAAGDDARVPLLFGRAGRFRSTAGVLEPKGACFLMRPPGEPPPAELVPLRCEVPDPPPFDLFVRGFGAAGALIDRVLAHARVWDGAGRPGTDGLRIRAYPIDRPFTPAPGEIVVPKRWSRLVLDWPVRP